MGPNAPEIHKISFLTTFSYFFASERETIRGYQGDKNKYEKASANESQKRGRWICFKKWESCWNCCEQFRASKRIN